MLVGSSRSWRGPRFLIANISDASILEQHEVVVIHHGRSRSGGGEANEFLHSLNHGVDHDKSFHYHSVIGKFNYLEKATRPDISFATHQCARFAEKSHTRAVRWLGRYLLHTKKKGMRFRADITRGLEVFVVVSFAGNWDKKDAQNGDRDTA